MVDCHVMPCQMHCHIMAATCHVIAMPLSLAGVRLPCHATGVAVSWHLAQMILPWHCHGWCVVAMPWQWHGTRMATRRHAAAMHVPCVAMCLSQEGRLPGMSVASFVASRGAQGAIAASWQGHGPDMANPGPYTHLTLADALLV